MNLIRSFATSSRAIVVIAVGLALNTGISASGGDHHSDAKFRTREMRINAGTTFNLNTVFGPDLQPVFPWLHEVRGIAQVSDLGNCNALFQVAINGGSACPGGHVFCLSGTMKLTTLAGDELTADVVGWADPDPNDPNPQASTYTLHYDVVMTGGTGSLQGATGKGVIKGAFQFCGANCFCDSYAGVATWMYDGVLRLPRRSR